jgi:hypothetical protein
MAAKPKYYWDACIFFAWLNNEEDIHGLAVMDGILEMAEQFDKNAIVLISSLITKTEVFDHKLKTQWARDEFSKRFQRDNFLWVAQDERVTDKSRSIRDFHARKGVTLGATDCVHLATAILYKADVFYTLDGSGDPPKPNSLLLLNGHVAGYPLRIEKPHKAQANLFPGAPKAVSSAISPIGKNRKRTRKTQN